jgi:hypothetical protein
LEVVRVAPDRLALPDRVAVELVQLALQELLVQLARQVLPVLPVQLVLLELLAQLVLRV